MNERIKKIAKDACVLGDWGEDVSEGRFFITGNTKQMEKFAELIVEECGRIADVFCHIWCEEDKPHDVTVSNYIKRHVLRADPE